ncbi:hypothetical protein [Nocardia alni]|uniref:hypothetical protein n=1 Tax=Nocardia alni TaxID=2815723 RepID=UPI001C242B3B|nr:hypothetical protein [Nocardia alni]
MTRIDIEDLPAATVDVLRRRAQAGGRSTVAQIRSELIELARRPVAIDAVVDFLESERPVNLEVDTDAVALIRVYGLPMEAVSVLVRRAGASGVPIADYVRTELITLARRGSERDALLEFEEATRQNPNLDLNMDAIAASVRYARAI